MNITTLGIDIAKQVFQLHGTDGRGKVTLKKRLRRNQLLRFMQQLPPCLVGMEACAGAHYWARVRNRTPINSLDLMLPGEDGLEICRNLRARKSIPVIILSALG